MTNRSIRELEGDSLVLGKLPKGCRLCSKGSKMVLFVTGLCNSTCYYCPVSQEKSGRDVVFADEMPVSDEEDILYEMESIAAEGAGLSGGDPLCSLERTLNFIELLKTRKGKEFHLHLYTSQADAPSEVIRKLSDAGLDEIRFHPQGLNWSGIEDALSMGMTVGIEMPAIPNQSENLIRVAQRAEEIGVSFLNMNELESSETNFERLVSLGMKLTSLDKASINGSADTAERVLQWGAENLKSLTLHFCSARFKDSIQLRNRLERRLANVIRPLEERDDSEPLLILGIIRAPHGQELNEDHLQFLEHKLQDLFEVPQELMNVDYRRKRIEIAPWILEEIAGDLRHAFTHGQVLEIGIAHEYPTWDRLQTLFDPL
jgi:pyruvate formate-lyase activating enzyme-like uncharacterized protein